jgi:peptidase, M50 family
MFNIDRKTVLIILGVMVLVNVLLGQRSIEGIIISLPGVIVAMTFHEFAHAWAATKLGDETPRQQGRLSLNPISHIDPVGLICLMLLGFGWGKPVQINPRNFDGKYSISKAEAIVAAAGPIMNFILAFVFLIIYAIFGMTVTTITTTTNVISSILISIISINLGLGVFNLIPIYPLDGAKVLNNFLPYKAKEWLIKNQAILTIIVFAIVFYTDIIPYITTWVLKGMIWLVDLIIGLFV